MLPVPGPAGYRRKHREPAARLRMKTPPELPGTSSRRIERRRSVATASSASTELPVGRDEVESLGPLQSFKEAGRDDQNVRGHRPPDLGRRSDCGLRLEWPWRLEFAPGQGFCVLFCSALVFEEKWRLAVSV